MPVKFDIKKNVLSVLNNMQNKLFSNIFFDLYIFTKRSVTHCDKIFFYNNIERVDR